MRAEVAGVTSGSDLAASIMSVWEIWALLLSL